MIRRILHGAALSAVAGAMVLAVTALHAVQATGGYDLALVSVDGTRRVLGPLPASVFAPRLSPDGARVAFETRDTNGADGARLWIADVKDLSSRRSLSTVVGRLNWAPVWSVDGQRLVFLVSGDRPDALYWRRADGTGDAAYLVDARSAEGWIGLGAAPPAADGAGAAGLQFLTLTGNRDYGISVLDLQTRKPAALIDLPGSAQHSGAVSPDGRWIAYASNETGRYEVWLEPLPRTGSRYQLTRDGGGHPLWLPDGKALYIDRQQQIFRLAIDTASPSTVEQPVALPVQGFVQGELRRQYDVMPDGSAFVMLFAR